MSRYEVEFQDSERERIIALLEAEGDKLDRVVLRNEWNDLIALLEPEGALDSCFIGNDIHMPSLVALIKGENK